MTWGYTNDKVGYMLSTLLDPWLLYPMMAALKAPRHLLKWPKWDRTLGVMIKIKDDISGVHHARRRDLQAHDRTRCVQDEPRGHRRPQDSRTGRRGSRFDLHHAATRHAPERHRADRDGCSTPTFKRP